MQAFRLFAGVSNDGVYRSDDGGDTWEANPNADPTPLELVIYFCRREGNVRAAV